MADNVIIPTTGSGTATPTVATDDVSSVHYQRVKIDLGGDGLASPLVRGALTAANSLPTTLATDDPAVVALQILDNAISGSEMQVDVVAALPAGTNNIGDVDIASIAAGTNNIGDVDVLSLIPGTGATNLGKAIDTATGATDTGVLALATRDDALSALTPIEGDNVQLRTDANGALWTHDDALDAALAGSELQVDIVGSLPAGTAAIGKLAANSGVDIGDVDILSIAAGDNNIGNVDIVTLPALVAGSANIGDVDVASIAAGDNNIGNVDVVSSALPTGASTLAEQQSQTTHLATIAGDTTDIETAVELLDDTVATLGTTTYTEATTKGLIVGAVRRDADTTLVDTTNEVGPLQMDANGRLKVEVFSGETLPVSLTSTTITGTVAATQSGTWSVGHGKTPAWKTGSASATFTLVAAVASKKIKAYSLNLTTSSTTAVTITFKDGAAGTVLGTYTLQAISGTRFGIVDNVSIPSSLFETSAGTLLEMAFSAAVSVDYNVRYWADDAV